MKKALIASVMAFSCVAAGAAGMEGWSMVSQTEDHMKLKHANGVEVELFKAGELATADEAVAAVAAGVTSAGLQCGDPYKINEDIAGAECGDVSVFFRYSETDKQLVIGYTKCDGDACAPVLDLLNAASQQ